MEYLQTFIDIVFHLDVYLGDLIAVYESWIYLILFLVIFFETGVVFAAFLPGDALLFITGTLAAIPDNPLNVHLIALLLVVAAILGDSTNYSIGRRFGIRLLRNPNSRIFREKHMEATHRFFSKYGGKTIVLARFVPFVRTFAPFIAGMGRMNYNRFLYFNVIGALIWVISLVYTGFFLGNIPAVQDNLTWFIVAIIILSNIPAISEIIKKRFSK